MLRRLFHRCRWMLSAADVIRWQYSSTGMGFPFRVDVYQCSVCGKELYCNPRHPLT